MPVLLDDTASVDDAEVEAIVVVVVVVVDEVVPFPPCPPFDSSNV